MAPMTDTPPLRQPCPPGLCDCQQQALRNAPGADQRVLRLTEREEKILVQRLEQLRDLDDLYYMLGRLEQQLGIRLQIEAPAGEVRTVRGLVFEFAPQPGLCRKTRKALPAALRRALVAQPHILYALLDSHGLFGNP